MKRHAAWLALFPLAIALGACCGDDGSSTGTGGAGAGGSTATGGECIPGETRACTTVPAESQGKGICQGGVAVCDATGTWSDTCLDETLPAAEICGNGIDEDCSGADAPVAECLASDPAELVVRHFLDEAAGTTTLADAGPLGFDLTLVGMGSAGALTSLDGHAGIAWPGTGLSIQADAPLEASFIEALAGPTMTIEVVVAIDEVATQDSPIVYIGPDFTPYLALQAAYDDTNQNDAELISFLWNETETQWRTTLKQRCVLHLVLDTQAQKMTLYRNGVELMAESAMPIPGATVDVIEPGQSYVLGNRANSSRSFKGMLYYAALYNVALDGETIEAHKDLLLQDDDGP